MPQYDVVVVGLGAMGSATLHQLASRGFRAIGIEQFAPGHDRGSSHGETRIIRLGYFEHPSYVPLLRRTYELWREIEAAAGRKLMRLNGIVEIGMSSGPLVTGTLTASREHGLPHEVLDAAEVMRRFTPFRLPSDYVGVFQPDGGFVAVEASIEIMVALARAAGADVLTGMPARTITPRGGGVRVLTDAGEIEARIAIVTAGPWLTTLLPDLPVPVRVTREVMAWFRPPDLAPFQPAVFPVFIMESQHGMHYGFPASPAGLVKIAKHHHRDEATDPREPARPLSANDELLIRFAIESHIPAANGPLVAGKTCLYTVTPDHHFIIDSVADAPQIIVASPCSGHGFKFAPVIGEILTDIALEGGTQHDIRRFRLRRFR
jgi:sarcosine oxidase